MKEDKEISMLHDTLHILKQGWYEKDGERKELKLSREEMKMIRVCLPNVVEICSHDPDFDCDVVNEPCGHSCENTDSFTMARKRLQEMDLSSGNDQGILVLNMANPYKPGGGVRHGALAQEEDLCRKSSLLLSLENWNAHPFYSYHKKLGSDLASNALMITPKVEIIKDQDGNLLDDTVIVSVLTCAAPIISDGKEGMSEADYEDMVYRRIMGMLKCAAFFKYRYLVLGAWGCGAFGNDARIISDLFYRALKEIDYNGHGEKDLFRQVDFAILDRSPDQYNFKEFSRNFSSENLFRDDNGKENN